MKRLCIITLAILCFGFCQEMYAEIRNGYEEEILKVEKWLNQLQEIANGPLNEAKREKMSKKLEDAHAFVAKIRTNFLKTQALVDTLKAIDPAFYQEINTIQDSEGNETDVYIKVVDRLSLGMLGATNLDHSDDNPNIYHSAYGDHTVSVSIVNTGTIRAVLILVHELGHVRYQVPHLADYTRFYENTYQNNHVEGVKKGHHPDDPSYRTVEEATAAFRASWAKYNNARKRTAKIKSGNSLVSNREP